jgi:hypothetical protein
MSETPPTPQEFLQMKLDFIALNKRIHEASFRMSDDLKQVQKGMYICVGIYVYAYFLYRFIYTLLLIMASYYYIYLVARSEFMT